MATWDDVRAAALRFPETVEDHSRELVSWRIRDKLLAWERPLRATDRQALGPAAPEGSIVAFRTTDLERKEQLLAEHAVLFTMPHFDGYPALLARLEDLPGPLIERLIAEAWLDRAPKRLVRAWLEREGPPE